MVGTSLGPLQVLVTGSHGWESAGQSWDVLHSLHSLVYPNFVFFTAQNGSAAVGHPASVTHSDPSNNLSELGESETTELLLLFCAAGAAATIWHHTNVASSNSRMDFHMFVYSREIQV